MDNTNDEKIIRKLYGEEMWHYCRGNFASILEYPGVLSEILEKTFAPSHNVYSCLKEEDSLADFKNIIYKEYNMQLNETDVESYEIESPGVLLEKAGYKLYECNTEKDIQEFKKYYEPDEELCTFKGGRLNSCYVFFAVKKNVANIKREDYKHPMRQDEYGTSVISIQFTRDSSHILSIKNRYNHTVYNPDATFSNDLDNIIAGLTDSFEKYYDLKPKVEQENELDGFVKATDGRYYKYNIERNNIYYCDNNMILDNFEPIDKYSDKTKYLLIDNYIFDMQNKKVIYYDEGNDSFIDTLENIDKMSIEKTKLGKNIIIKQVDNEIVIGVNKYNQIVSYSNPKIEFIGDSFLPYNETLTSLDLPNITSIGNYFLYHNTELTSLKLPNVTSIGDYFLYCNTELTSLDLPKVTTIDCCFLSRNKKLTSLDLPDVTAIGDDFLATNEKLDSINLPNATSIGSNFLHYNEKLDSINLPNVTSIGNDFLYYNTELASLNLPNVTLIGRKFLSNNTELASLNLPNVTLIGRKFLSNNTNISIKDFRSEENDINCGKSR